MGRIIFENLKLGGGAVKALGLAGYTDGGIPFAAAMDAEKARGAKGAEAVTIASRDNPAAHRAYVAALYQAGAWRRNAARAGREAEALAQAVVSVVQATGATVQLALVAVAKGDEVLFREGMREIAELKARLGAR